MRTSEIGPRDRNLPNWLKCSLSKVSVSYVGNGNFSFVWFNGNEKKLVIIAKSDLRGKYFVPNLEKASSEFLKLHKKQ